MRKFSERIAIVFNYLVSTDTGNMSNNIPPLDEFDKGKIFST